MSVMICWLCNGDGAIGLCVWGGGGRGQHYKPSVVCVCVWGGGRYRNKNWARGSGSPKK